MAKEKKEVNPLARLYLARKKAEEGTCPNDDAFRERYPNLWALTTTWWLDQEHRVEAAEIKVRVVVGDWIFTLSSPAMGASKSVCVPTYEGGLDALERVVADQGTPWTFWLKRRAKIKKVSEDKNGLAIDGAQ